MPRHLILASASPRRSELLRNAGIDFSVRVSNIEEVYRKDEPAIDYVRRLAREKANAVPLNPGEMILAADTVVEVDGRILEKPQDEEDARQMLRQLSGKPHFVHTGIFLRSGEHQVSDVSTTAVYFLPMTDQEITDYVASEEPMDKAGAYAIQGGASKFIDRIEGCYFNVVGLPVSKVWQLIQSHSI